MAGNIVHEIKTAIATGGSSARISASDNSALLDMRYLKGDALMEAIDNEYLCIAPLDAPEFMPNGSSGFVNNCSTVTRA